MTRLTTLRWASYCIIAAGAGITAVAGIAAVAAIVAAPGLETRHLPAVTDWRATATRLVDGRTLLRVSAGHFVTDAAGRRHAVGGKVRPECVYLGRSQQDMMIEEPGSLPREIDFSFPNDAAPDGSRPAGAQDFGAWIIETTPATPAGSVITGVARHRCHLGWETSTAIGGPGFVVPAMPSDGITPADSLIVNQP